MKTTDEIKNGLSICMVINAKCKGCAYNGDGCCTRLAREALAYIKQLESDRDAWKRRAEAAERDIRAMLRSHVDDMHCDQCVNAEYKETCLYYGKDMCPDADWRGPCAENGGAEDGDQADPV